VGEHQEEPRPYTDRDRKSQLRKLEELSAQMAAIAAPHDSYLAHLFGARAEGAARLLSDGFVQSQLNDLGYMYPKPAWLDPRQVDYNGPREPWQEQIAEIHHVARKIALELRGVARFA